MAIFSPFAVYAFIGGVPMQGVPGGESKRERVVITYLPSRAEDVSVSR